MLAAEVVSGLLITCVSFCRLGLGFGGERDDLQLSALIWAFHALVTTLKVHTVSVLTSALVIGCLTVTWIVLSLLPSSLFAQSEPTQSAELPRRLQRHQPLLYPCLAKHTRLFPRKHAFQYSYLQVGLPIVHRPTQDTQRSLVAESQLCPTRSQKIWNLCFGPWFQVRAADHLSRGNESLGLRGKLDLYLRGQGKEPQKWPFAYLITSPTVLGYSFNPVSFWYLYDAETAELGATILEVNNTFDERRMYLLTLDQPRQENQAELSDLAGQDQRSKPLRDWQRHAWQKDFHVSPFNSRKGTYESDLREPATSRGGNNMAFRNQIILHSSKGHTKLIASIASHGPALDPARMTLWAKVTFILRWLPVGFLTYPRIVFEAGRLFFLRRLHVWFRPEVAATSIGRRPTQREHTIESAFALYLETLAPGRLRYIPAQGTGRASRSQAPDAFSQKDDTPLTLPTLRVLTPAFYSELAQSSAPGTIVAEIASRPVEQRTVVAEPLEQVLSVLTAADATALKRRLSGPRTHSMAQKYAMKFSFALNKTNPLDCFIYTAPTALASDYYRSVLVLRLASRWTAGWTEPWDVLAWIVRIGLGWKSMQYIADLVWRNPQGNDGPSHLIVVLSALHLLMLVTGARLH